MAVLPEAPVPVTIRDVGSGLLDEGNDLAGDFVGSKVVIGIQPLDVVALRVGEAEITGVIGSWLGAVVNVKGTVCGGGKSLSDRDSVIGGTVIDEDDFEVGVGLLEDALQAETESGGSVVGGNDDGDEGFKVEGRGGWQGWCGKCLYAGLGEQRKGGGDVEVIVWVESTALEGVADSAVSGVNDLEFVVGDVSGVAAVEIERLGQMINVGDFREFEAQVVVFGRGEGGVNAADLLVDRAP